MSYQYPEIKTFKGLYSQSNTFNIPDGALEICENAVIQKDATISKTRGFYQYYDPSSDVLNNLFQFDDHLFAVFSDKIAYFTDTGSSPSETGVLHTLTGATVTLTAPKVSRSVESNENFYFTTDNGVLKLESFSSKVYAAGVPPARELSGMLTGNGFLPDGKTVGYRVLFGRRDSNENLLIGAPSDILTLQNVGMTGVSWARVSNTVTVTTTTPHELFSNTGALPSGILVSGSTGATPVPSTTYDITVTTPYKFTFTSTAADSSGTLNYTTPLRAARVEFSIPPEINTTADGYFFQIYRSSYETTDIELNFRFLEERVLTAAEIALGFAFFEDDVLEILREGGAELYTNPNSGEGESQKNSQPPLCEDLVLFKNHVIYGNCTTRHLLDLQVVDADAITAASYIEISIGTTLRRYIARAGVANLTVYATVSSSAGLLVTYDAHGLSDGDSLYISNVVGGSLTSGTYYVTAKTADTFKIATTPTGSPVAYAGETALDFEGVLLPEGISYGGLTWARTSNTVVVSSTAHGLFTGDKVSIISSSGGSPNVTLDVYLVTVINANTFSFSETAANSSGTLGYARMLPMFRLQTDGASESLSETAQGIVKAIDRDSGSLISARYSSLPSDPPGRMSFMERGFGDPIYVRASSTGVGQGFSPVLPASFSSGTQVFSTNNSLPNVVFSSKTGEPEAVPLINQFPIGARNKAIIRIVALRDSVIILKEDGIFRLTGDNPFNFTITAIDTTVFCLVASSVALLTNQVFCLTNQGVVLITDTSVQIISRKIEDPISAVIGSSSLVDETSSVAYESDRLYMLSTLAPRQTSKTTTYIYNILNDSWSTTTNLFDQGAVGPNDRLYLISSEGKLNKERKNQTRIDYCGQNYDVTVVSVASNSLSGVIYSPSIAPVEGDVIVKGSNFTRLKEVTAIGADDYTVVFEQETNLVAADAKVMYNKYTTTIKTAPFHAGLVGRNKQFAQMQIHTRDTSISRLSITFAGPFFGSSEEVIWRSSEVTGTSQEVAEDGWGDEPWGLFGWGEDDNIDIEFGTQVAPIIRVYVPLFQQRSSFIQPVLVHESAGEALNIQAISWSVRGYGERESR